LDDGRWLLLDLSCGKHEFLTEDAMCMKIGYEFFIHDVEASNAASLKEKKRIKKLRAQVGRPGFPVLVDSS